MPEDSIRRARLALAAYGRKPVLAGLSSPGHARVSAGMHEALSAVLDMCGNQVGLDSEAVAETILTKITGEGR